MCGFAGIGLLQPGFHVVAQIRASLPARARTRAPHAEDAFEQVGKRGGKIRAETARPACWAILERGMAKAIIRGALVRIFEDLIGFVDFLEARLARLVAGIAIGVPFHRQLAKGRFQFPLIGSAVDLKNFVIAALGHARVHAHRVRH